MVKITYSPEAKEALDFLEQYSKKRKQEKMIFNAFMQKLESIKINPFYGDSLKKDLIPNYYKVKYSVSNLFRVELPQFWRMLYTLTKDEKEIEIIAFVLDIFDHKRYDKKFRYKKK